MLKLDIKTEPYWIDLPAKVRVKVKPMSTAIMGAAQAMMKTAYNKMVESGDVDPSNDPQRVGIGQSLMVKALAGLSIVEWEGVQAVDSTDPAPINEQTISDLMDFWLIAQDFLSAYVTQFRLLETEGNVLAPAANGISVAEAPIAGSAT